MSPHDRQTEEAAARELLRAKWGYTTGATTVEPFRREAVSLPERDDGAPWLADVLPHEDRVLLSEVKERLLKDVAENMEILDYADPVEPYMDQVLAKDQVKHKGFYHGVARAGAGQLHEDAQVRLRVIFRYQKRRQAKDDCGCQEE